MSQRSLRLLTLPLHKQREFVAGVRNTSPVRGLTHNFYKYPARFSPSFARAAIEAFTSPGDVVLDPHMGGATSLVEAMALGRSALGVDISSLAQFVATVKTTIYNDDELSALDRWVHAVSSAINLRRLSIHFAEYEEQGYYLHLRDPSRWRFRKAIEQSLGTALQLRSERLEAFARCAVLRTAQWALDGRKHLPSLAEFRAALTRSATEMIEGARALRESTSLFCEPPRVRVLHRSSNGLETDERLHGWPSPQLVLTSPPYPGIHVLYHRWQVDGRKEAPLPFWIAGKLDGAGSSYYTMGDRKHPNLTTYFKQISGTMSSIAALCEDRTVIVQMLAFSDPSWQLPRYLEVMEQAGFTESFIPLLQGEPDGRLWRSVPNRRWYSDQRGATPGSQEVVLIHRRQPSSQWQLPDRRTARPPKSPQDPALSARA